MATCNHCHDNAELLQLQAKRIGTLRETLEAIDQLSADPVIARMAKAALVDDKTVRLSTEGSGL